MVPYGNIDLAPSHCRNQCWLTIKGVLWHSPEGYFKISILDMSSKMTAGKLTHWGLVTPYGDNNSGSTLAQEMACCLMAPSHYLNQCWLISEVEWHSSSQEIPQSIIEIIWKIKDLKFHSNFPGANELRLQLHLPGNNELMKSHGTKIGNYQ